MGIQNNYVLENGKLNDSLIVKREVLYKGPNGREVERIFVLSATSYIFKPLSTVEEDNKEIWIYENILPSFPSIYPKIIDKSPDDSKNTRWIIYEDLGNIRHLFTEKVVLQVIEQMITWHSLQIDTVINEPLIGAKPKIEEVRNDLHSNMDEGMQTFSQLRMDKERILRILKLMEEADFTQFPVLVHGDLHLGNYGLSHGK
ncbi:MAG: protein licA, partial [Bacillota bacterium]|nr:protein licA [Bacillota bacterium]